MVNTVTSSYGRVSRFTGGGLWQVVHRVIGLLHYQRLRICVVRTRAMNAICGLIVYAPADTLDISKHF